MPGLLKRYEELVCGNRFCSIVREVLNLMDAVVKVESSACRGWPKCDCRGPGMGPNAIGIRQ